MATVVPFPGVNPERHIRQLELVRPHDEGVFSHQVVSDFELEIPTFKQDLHTHTGGAALSATREVPVVLDNPTDLMWVQGYLGPERLYQKISHEVTQHRRASTTMGRAGPQSPLALLHPKHFFKPATVTKQSPGAVLKLLGSQVDIAAHSMGGPISVETALRNPDRVRTLVLLGSAGLTGHGIPDLAARLPQAANEVRRNIPELIQLYGYGTAMQMVQYFYGNPLRPIDEALYVARADIRGDLPRIRQAGTRVVVIAFDDDCFFDLDRMYEETKGKIDLFIPLDTDLAGHIAPLLRYKTVAKAVIDGINEVTA